MPTTSAPFHYYSIRTITNPHLDRIGVQRRCGYAEIKNIVNLSTHENVRDYLLDAQGRKNKKRTRVLMAIEQCLTDTPDWFSLLNGGTVIVATGMVVDDKGKIAHLENASIINGAQTQGVIRDVTSEYEDVEENYVSFEILVTDDTALLAEIAIARNFQNAVQEISIAGRRGVLDPLAKAFAKHYNGSPTKLRTKETELGEDYVDTLKLLQVLMVLTPPELWNRKHNAGQPIKTFTYNLKTKCLRYFQETALKSKDRSDPDHKAHKQLYDFYLSQAGRAWEEYLKWRTNEKFVGHHLKCVKRGPGGKGVLSVSDGLLFPILSAVSLFYKRSGKTWDLSYSAQMEKDVIESAVRAFRGQANSKPHDMGTNKTCYLMVYEKAESLRREARLFERLPAELVQQILGT